MLSEPTYIAARMVAVTIEAHFATHLAEARRQGATNLADEPQSPIVEAIIDVAFWASLRKEEGHSPKISIALLPPHQASQPLIFGNRIRLTPHNLTKLAPAVESPGIHLGVWYENDELYVWGTTLAIPGICFVLEVIEPGLLVIKHSRTDGFGKFVNIAVLKGDEIKIVDEQNTGMKDCPALFDTIAGIAMPFVDGTVNIMVELAASMRIHGRGGLVLIVPEHSDNWKESIIHPINYPVVPTFDGIAKLLKQDKCDRSKIDWQEALLRSIDIVGGFTAVDGATIINRSYELLAFGAKIARSGMSLPVDRIITTEPVMDGTPTLMHPGQNGGTRHLAAAQFIFDQRDAIALVASQDGRFTIFAWSPKLEMVHAHRIDILLL
ncbi:putative sensor domain DACNV-containing protein [Mucilaginibacter sp. UYCu711]|uniref:putative sensor domain DACNV-containing protein n=1 Tax=Mucilaginibacter sp. UYCu711 TaxID=3156339 RepID=UPI003D1A37A2